MPAPSIPRQSVPQHALEPMQRPYSFQDSGLQVDLSTERRYAQCGNSYDALIVSASDLKANASFSLPSSVVPEQSIQPVSDLLENAVQLAAGLSPVFETGSASSIDNAFNGTINPSDEYEHSELLSSTVDYIFALSHRKAQDIHGEWPLTKDIWDEACALLLDVVGPGKRARIWTPEQSRKRLPDSLTWELIYAYLVWPVIFVGETFRNHYGILSLGTWTALQCTAGLVGHGLFCRTVPRGVGPVLQTIIQHSSNTSYYFNQCAQPNRSLDDILTVFSAHVDSYRLFDYLSISSAVYESLHTHVIPITSKRNEYGPLVYGPLNVEEPEMLSGWRHELISSRWQNIPNMGFCNDFEWAPMESGLRIATVSPGESPVNPRFVCKVFSTGGQGLACLHDIEHGRRTMLLIDGRDDLEGRILAYFRHPSFQKEDDAIRIAWEGPYRIRRAFAARLTSLAVRFPISADAVSM